MNKITESKKYLFLFILGLIFFPSIIFAHDDQLAMDQKGREKEYKRQVGEQALKGLLGDALEATCVISGHNNFSIESIEGSGVLVAKQSRKDREGLAILSAAHLVDDEVREIIRHTPDLTSLQDYITIDLNNLTLKCAFGEEVDSLTSKFRLTKAIVLRSYIESKKKILDDYGEDNYFKKSDPRYDYAFFSLETFPEAVKALPLFDMAIMDAAKLSTAIISCYFNPSLPDSYRRIRGCALTPGTLEDGGWFSSPYFDPSNLPSSASSVIHRTVEEYSNFGKEMLYTIRRMMPSNSGGPTMVLVNSEWQVMGVLSSSQSDNLTAETLHRAPEDGDSTNIACLVYKSWCTLICKDNVTQMLRLATL